MDDLKKEKSNDSRETPRKQQQKQPPSASKSELPETSREIRASTWITLAILGSTILITMYGETMLLPAIRDVIRDFHISYTYCILDTYGIPYLRGCNDSNCWKVI